MVISMTFQTNIKLYSISVPRRIFSEQKGFLTVNVHNSKTRTLRNEDSALQRNAQHMVGDDVISFHPCCGVAKSVRNFDATYHDVTPVKLDSRPHYDCVLRTQLPHHDQIRK